ncbi:histidine phosphatase family protein [uncultured Sphingomonas sp.]|uniref:SixA phosphatase family protein n=1 Tax=uncultured Sphingomonas sp. TaxID=158754 RepID=UPI0025FC132A|nr:histidine phosphatase family protein [uncultured Sphingomonas sp.]
MKRVTLLRHAKSGEDFGHARDFDRTLNPKGRRAAQVIGRHMRDADLSFDAVIASPAVRVAETLEEVEAGYGRALSPDWRRSLYLASADDLLDAIHAAPDDAASLLLVGHNPGLEQLVLLLTPDNQSGTRRDVEAKYPTGSMAEIRFDVERWDEVAPGGGELVRFVRPRDLDVALGPEYA